MILAANNESIEMVTDQPVAVQWSTAWIDSVANSLPASTDGSQALIGSTTIVPAPAVGQRKVTLITATNVGASLTSVGFRKAVGGSSVLVRPYQPLLPGESISYSFGNSWRSYSDRGRRLRSEILSGPDLGSAYAVPWFYSGTAAGTIGMGGGPNGIGAWMVKATRRRTSVDVHFRVTTAAIAVTYAEAAIAVAHPAYTNDPGTVGQGPPLKFVGFTDISAVVTSLGIKRVTVTCATDQEIAAGDDIWMCLACSAVTQLVVRSTNGLGEDTYNPISAQLTSIRPSAFIGQPFVVPDRSNTAAQPWYGISGV